jgi:RHS repeat-associated protein
VADGVTQKFTGKERDAETGLDYFLARYYSGPQGRFTSPDEFKGEIVDALSGQDIDTDTVLTYADIRDPQTLNKYVYVRNSPLRYVDPDGHGDPTLMEEIDEVVKPLVDSAEGAIADTVSVGARTLTGAAGLLLLAPNTEGNERQKREYDEFVRQLHEQQVKQQQQQKPQQQNPGQVKPATPSPQDAEHTKGARPSTKEKHQQKRPGTSPPPNYKPFRKHERSDEEKKKEKEKPPYHRKDRDRKPDQG